MQPSKLSIAELFQTREQYLIPLFQRGYVWTLDKHVSALEDIIDRVELWRSTARMLRTSLKISSGSCGSIFWRDNC